MKIICPLYIELERKTMKNKKVSLNMNWYRNCHFIMSNQVKIKFKEIIQDQLKWKTFKTPYGLCLTIYYARISDLDNWDAVLSKFFNDTLVELWCVPDDNMKYFIEKHTTVWGKDTKNPRMEIEII